MLVFSEASVTLLLHQRTLEVTQKVQCLAPLQNSACGGLQPRAMQGSNKASLGIGCGVGLEPKLLWGSQLVVNWAFQKTEHF